MHKRECIKYTLHTCIILAFPVLSFPARRWITACSNRGEKTGGPRFSGMATGKSAVDNHIDSSREIARYKARLPTMFNTFAERGVPKTDGAR